jgi:type I restriction enzyme M protein
MKIYDPCCGSGGMLILSREFVEESGEDPRNLRLCGQDNGHSAWAICKLNMILHGIPDADIQREDTLLHPLHREGGELERFDRVITNPPFSQNYTRSDMEFPERFDWGWCPTMGKKGDLMFAQHMLAVCKPGGMLATVMPHGVLFRGGEEKKIRQKFIEQDLTDTIIGLPPNLFYGAGIPACILVMRPNLSKKAPNPNKPEEHRGKILFINADAEYYAGRAQNHLRPEHIEKIVSTFYRYDDVTAYARCVSLEEIRANDFNLNIRRYVDNSPPPEPQDVRAHLHGGVPVAEVEAKHDIFASLGFDPSHIFIPRNDDNRYFDFSSSITDRSAFRQLVEGDSGVRGLAQTLHDAFAEWWTEHAPHMAQLPGGRGLNTERTELLESFVAALEPQGMLDHFKLAGVIATWWAETLPDLKTLLENGFPAVIDGWVDTIADALEEDEDGGPAFDPFKHKLVRTLMADVVEKIANAKPDITRLKAEKEAFEQSNQPEDADEEELLSWNYAKDLERQIKELRGEHRNAFKELTKLEKVSQKEKAMDADRAAFSQARTQLKPVLDQLATLEAALQPYEQIKRQLAEVRARYQRLVATFIDQLKARCAVKTDDQKQALVLDLMAEDAQAGLDAAVVTRRQELIRFFENLWDKYRATLYDLYNERTDVATQLQGCFTELGYK